MDIHAFKEFGRRSQSSTGISLVICIIFVTLSVINFNGRKK